MIKVLKNKEIFNYPAIFEPAIEGGYNVFFPNFQGCVTFGATFEEAKKNAREVLELWIEEMTSQGQKIPVFKSRPVIDDVSAEVSLKAKKTYATINC